MTQIAVLQGIKSDAQGSINDSLPINLEPTLANSGISQGYLSSTPGITQLGTALVGRDRASINWKGINYRIQGSKLISVDKNGSVIIIGDVGDDGNPAFMAYGFDRLAIASNSFLWYYNGTILYQVTDPSAVNVYSVIWIDGYFMFTDRTNLVVTELANPDLIIPTEFQTPEIDPNPVQGMIVLHDEVYSMGLYTIQNFQNTGGSGFPFTNNKSAFIPRGSIGTKSFCIFDQDYIAFVGAGRDEAISIYLGLNGESQCIATNYVESLIQSLTAEQQQQIEVETIVESRDTRLLVHLPTMTLVYSKDASAAAGTPIWNILAGGINGDEEYPIRHFTFCYNMFIGGNPTTGALGFLDRSVSTQFGSPIAWEFNTTFIYDGSGFTITQLELIAMTGRTPLGDNPTISFSYSNNSITYSQEQFIKQGKLGQYNQRLVWWPMAYADNYMTLKFRGSNTSIATILRLEAQIEGSNL